MHVGVVDFRILNCMHGNDAWQETETPSTRKRKERDRIYMPVPDRFAIRRRPDSPQFAATRRRPDLTHETRNDLSWDFEMC